MNNIIFAKSISSKNIATLDSSAPLEFVDSPKEMFAYGGIAVAVIFALSFFILAINYYSKTQVESLTKLIKTVTKK